MNVLRKMIAPSHAIFFIAGQEKCSPPSFGERIEIVASDDCVIVPCQYEGDGDTNLVVGHYSDVTSFGRRLMFDGMVRTPSRALVLSEVDGTILADVPVKSTTTRIRIRTDRPDQPTMVVVGVD